MKALVIAPQPFFSPRGTPMSVYYRTMITAEFGVRIDLLTYGEGEDVDIAGVCIKRIPNFHFLGNVKIGPSYLKAFLDILLLIWTIGLLIKNRYTLVHAHEEAVFFCTFLKPIFKFKLIYDMHSRLSEQLRNFNFTKSKILSKIFKILETLSLKSADAVITICPDLSLYVDDVIPNSKKNFLIENSIFETVRLLQKNNNSISHNKLCAREPKVAFKPPAKKNIILYAGTLETYQGIEILISAFKLLLDELPNCFLIIVGGNCEQVAHYKKLVSKSGIKKNVHFTGQVIQMLAKYYSNLAHVLVSPRTHGTNTPLKIYEQLASGITLVATNIYSHTQVLNNDVAILVEPDPESMAYGIKRALTSESDRKRLTQNAKKLYKNQYSKLVYKEKIQKVLNFLI